MKWLLPLVTGAVSLSLTGQQAEQKPARTEGPDTRIILEVNRVNMLFTVTDKKAQGIKEFTAESDLPLRIAILVDTSNSIRDRFRFEQQAAIDFITSVIRPRQDKAMIV